MRLKKKIKKRLCLALLANDVCLVKDPDGEYCLKITSVLCNGVSDSDIDTWLVLRWNRWRSTDYTIVDFWRKVKRIEIGWEE